MSIFATTKKFDSVLVFGDSTAAGAELLLDSEPWATSTMKKRSFGNQLAEELNVPCYNYSLAGGSNSRSLRLLPEALLEHPNSLVIFCYTYIHTRTEFFCEDYAIPESFESGGPTDYTSYINFLANVPPNSPIGQVYNDMHHAWVKYFVSPNQNKISNYELYNLIFTVQTLCEKYASDFVHIMLYHLEIHPTAGQEIIWDHINKSKFFPFKNYHHLDEKSELDNCGYGSLFKWAEYSDYKFCSGGHIGQAAHDKFAEELYNIYK